MEPKTQETKMKPETSLTSEKTADCCAGVNAAKTNAAVKTKPRKLHIGGKVSHPEWELLNIQAGPNVDHIGDAKDLSQFEDETFDELYASHVAEHFDYRGPLVQTLREWHRVLKPGGKLYISVPDMNVLCQLFLNRRELTLDHRFHVMRMMFGGHVDRYDYHYVGLDFDILTSLLKMAKFRGCKRVEAFDIFDDTSKFRFAGVLISLNVIAYK